MGTIAEKLTYLNDTKQLLKENINNLGGNLTNEPFRQYASVLEGIYESLPKVSGIGASLSLSPSLMGKIKLNEIQGDTLQNGTPTPSSPVPIQSVTGLQNVGITGKNIFDISTKQEYKWLTYQGVIQNSTDPNIVSGFIKVIPGKQYVFSGIPTTTYSLRVCSYTSASQSSFKTELINNNPNNRTFIANADYIVFAVGNSDATTLNQIQLELGSTATTYEPYKGNTYEVNLGKNLFDIDATTSISGGTKTNNVITSSSYSSGTWKGMDVNFSSIPINQEFTISMDLRLTSGSTGTFSKFNDGVNNFTEITKPTISQNWQRYSYKYTPSSGYSISKIFIQMSAIDGQFECKNIQIEKGSQATSYSPYFTPIELNKIGTYEDSIKKSNGKNLFDKNTITENYRIGSDGLPYADNSCSLSDFIKVEPNTTYYINQTMSYQNTTALYDINKNYISPRIQSGNTFTTTSSTYYVRVSNLKANINTLMLNEGSTALPYEPYGKVWYVEKNIGKVVLNGSEEWVQLTNLGWWTRKNATIIKKSGLALSNKYTYTSSTWQGNYTFSINSSGFTAISDNTYSTLTNWQNYLSSNNVEVLHQLETPTYTEITNTELINQLETLYNAKSKNGTTNINVTSEDLSMLLNVSVIKGDA